MVRRYASLPTYSQFGEYCNTGSTCDGISIDSFEINAFGTAFGNVPFRYRVSSTPLTQTQNSVTSPWVNGGERAAVEWSSILGLEIKILGSASERLVCKKKTNDMTAIYNLLLN